MQVLTHPILQDCRRVIERSRDITPEHKHRLLTGLAAVDQELDAEPAPTPEPEAKRPKGAK